MNNMNGSKLLRFTLLFALVLSAANCGDESEVIILDLDCPALEGFAGGQYLFTVDVGEIVDGCADGAFNNLIDPGPYGPITLPATADLPQDVTITLPFVGVVTGTLSSDGGALRLTVEDPIQVVGIVLPIVGAVDVTARVSGTLCPISTTRVDAALTITVLDIDPDVPLIPTPCTVGVPGTLQ
jgi:hypothetical protein